MKGDPAWWTGFTKNMRVIVPLMIESIMYLLYVIQTNSLVIIW